MLRYLPVRRIHARQILDSRGNPAVEAEVTVGEGVVGIDGYTARAVNLRRSSFVTVMKRDISAPVWKMQW